MSYQDILLVSVGHDLPIVFIHSWWSLL